MTPVTRNGMPSRAMRAIRDTSRPEIRWDRTRALPNLGPCTQCGSRLLDADPPSMAVEVGSVTCVTCGCCLAWLVGSGR